MNGLVKQTEIEFSHFVRLLIVDTMQAVSDSLMAQEEQIAELEKSALMSPDEFGRLFITDDEVQAEAWRLFPGSKGEILIQAGSPYLPQTGEKSESPPVLKLTGYEMKKADWKKSESGGVITEKGQQNIMSAIRARMSIFKQGILHQLIKKGVPKVYVDHGRISSKLTVSLECDEKEPADRMKVRFLVQPINARGPEFLSLKADIVSEVEITFKTIT